MLTRLTSPTSEPLTLIDLKTYLKIDCADDDALVETLQTAAREYLEDKLNIAFTPTDFRLSLHTAPLKLALPITPVQALTAVNIEDETFTYVALDPAHYHLCDHYLTFTTPQKEIEILFTAGFTMPPAPLLLALRMLIAHWYETRGLHKDALLPSSITSLLTTFKKVRLI